MLPPERSLGTCAVLNRCSEVLVSRPLGTGNWEVPASRVGSAAHQAKNGNEAGRLVLVLRENRRKVCEARPSGVTVGAEQARRADLDEAVVWRLDLDGRVCEEVVEPGWVLRGTASRCRDEPVVAVFDPDDRGDPFCSALGAVVVQQHEDAPVGLYCSPGSSELVDDIVVRRYVRWLPRASSSLRLPLSRFGPSGSELVEEDALLDVREPGALVDRLELE